MIRQAIFWAYENLFVGLVVSIVTLYVASGVIGEWVAWIVVPATLVLSVISLTRFWFCLYDNGIAYWVWRKVSFIWNGTIEIFGNVYNAINISKFSRILWVLAVFNASLVVYYLYVNIDILQIFRTLFELARDFVQFISDPVQILRSFNILLQKLHVDKLLNFLKNDYLIPVIEKIEAGDSRVLLFIVMMTGAIIVLGFLPFVFHGLYRIYLEIFHGGNPLVHRFDSQESHPAHPHNVRDIIHEERPRGD